MKKPTIKIDLSGPDGNAFVIMGKVSKLLDKPTARKYQSEAMKGDYDNLLKVTKKYVTLK
jgi:hypothetical protein